MSITKIATVEVGSTNAAITFSAIPGTYTDLYLVMSLRNVSVGAFTDFKLNGVAGSGRYLYGNGSTTTSSTGSNFVLSTSAYTANTFGNASVYIPNYATSQFKSYSIDAVSENNGTAYQMIFAGLWSDSAAVTSLTIGALANLLQYSSATLYGVTKGSSGGVSVT